MPGLLPLPAPQTRDAYIDVHGIVRNCEITELLVRDTGIAELVFAP